MNKLEFNPMLSPKEILLKGAFGGSYFGIEDLQGDYNYQSLFEETLIGVPSYLYLGNKYKPKMNKFKTRAGMSYEFWVSKNWIHKDDPYGWFEWYLKYYNGRRHPDDERQIKRWDDFCGSNGRFKTRIYKMILEKGDWNASPRTQQSLLHWGYEINEKDFNEYKSSLL